MNPISRVSAIAGQGQTHTQGLRPQRADDLEALQSALQSGNLRAAQQALATLQQNQQTSSQTAGASNAATRNLQASSAFQALESALSSGNLSAAQQAFTTLQLECGA
jgi:hypothetical protein